MGFKHESHEDTLGSLWQAGVVASLQLRNRLRGLSKQPRRLLCPVSRGHREPKLLASEPQWSSADHGQHREHTSIAPEGTGGWSLEFAVPGRFSPFPFLALTAAFLLMPLFQPLLVTKPRIHLLQEGFRRAGRDLPGDGSTPCIVGAGRVHTAWVCQTGWLCRVRAL